VSDEDEPEPEPETAEVEDLAGDAPEPDADPDEAGEDRFSDLDREDLEEEARRLEAELEEAREEARGYLEKLRKTKADFDNYRKRKASEVEAARRDARDDLLEDLVEVLDSFDRALEQAGDEGAREGIEMIRKQFLTVLSSDGVERLEPEGEAFDPRVHEAVLREATDEVEEGTVLQVLEAGYVRGDETLRPARVKVASAPEAQAGESG
jgi:molecular chaperone GrpE